MVKLFHASVTFCTNKIPFVALKDINLAFKDRGLFFITGKSGSGKSTLLSVIGGLLSLTNGEYEFEGVSIKNFSKKEKEEFLASKVSFVFQDFNLLADFSIDQNLFLAGAKENETIVSLLDLVGLGNKREVPISSLSGGERQRLAIARALSKKTKVLLLDEPTCNLDTKNAAKVFSLIKKISQEKLVIAVTHDRKSVKLYGDYEIHLADGKVEAIKKFKNEVSSNISIPFANHKPHFSLSMGTNYAFSLLKKKKGRVTLSFIILYLSLSLTILWSVFFLFDEKSALTSAFETYGITFAPLYKLGEKDASQKLILRYGNEMAEGLKERNIPSAPFVNVTFPSHEDTKCRLFAIRKPVFISNKKIEVPKDGHIVISSSLKEKIGDKREFDILFPKEIYRQEHLAVEGVFLYSPTDSSKKDKEIQNGIGELSSDNIAFISLSQFHKSIASAAAFGLVTADFLHRYSLSSSSLYSKTTSYSLYEDTTLLFGNKPSKENDVVISYSYASSLVYGEDEMKEMVGKMYSYENFQNILKSFFEERMVDPFSLYKEVRIVGISKENESIDVMVHPRFFEKIKEKFLSHAGNGFYAFGNNAKELANAIGGTSFRADLKLAEVIYSLFDIFTKQFFFASLTIFLALILLSSLFLGLFSISNVKEKEKEFAVLKSLGIRESEISRIFFLENSFVIFPCLLLSFFSSLLVVRLLNSVFATLLHLDKPLVFFTIGGDNVLILFIVVLAVTIFSSLLPIFKTRKMDIAHILKELG